MNEMPFTSPDKTRAKERSTITCSNAFTQIQRTNCPKISTRSKVEPGVAFVRTNFSFNWRMAAGWKTKHVFRNLFWQNGFYLSRMKMLVNNKERNTIFYSSPTKPACWATHLVGMESMFKTLPPLRIRISFLPFSSKCCESSLWPSRKP